LSEAGVKVALREAEEEAKQKEAESEIQHRKNIAKGALELLEDITNRLFDRICLSAPTAKRRGGANVHVINLGQGELLVQPIYHAGDRLISYEAFHQSKWDVVAAAQISVSQHEPPYEWSASLWYSKLTADNNYRWREVSYFVNPLIPRDRLGIECEPFALKNLSDADEAASPTMGVYQIAYGPKPIDDENFDEFCSRWAERLAKAANGQLRRPRVLPLE
jgi:hypothetical protein